MYNDRYLDLNGISIRYREEGDGEALVLVHGIAGFIEEWQPAMEKLSKFYRVIALDLPGHGLSDKPEIPYTLDNLTDFLKDFITAKKLEHFYLAGHSLGGAVCLNFAVKYPPMIKKLIVINSAFIKIPFSLRLLSMKLFQRINIKVPLSIVRSISKQSFHDSNAITRDWLTHAYNYINRPGSLRAMFSVIHECTSFRGLKKGLVDTFLHGLSQINVPVLIIYSDKDRVLPNENSLLLHKLIKTSVIYRVLNCGHELQYEQSDVFCNIVAGFLENKL